MEFLAHFKESIRYELARQKLEENFLKWISLQSTNSLLTQLIEDCQSPNPQGPPTPSALFQSRMSTPAAPNIASPKRSSLTPPLSPSAYDKFSATHSQSLPPDGLQISPSKMQPKPQSIASSRPEVPQFFFPEGKPVESAQAEKDAKAISTAFFKEQLRTEEFERVAVAVCGLPKSLASMLFQKIAADCETVSKSEFLSYWKSSLEGKSPDEILFETLKKSEKNYIERDDFRPLMRTYLDTHPGLDFLKATPEFQDRYVDTVIERLFYSIDLNDTGTLSLRALKRSNLLNVLLAVDDEEDINKIRDYFSYEHFYVLYCRFWELDTDHDFYVDKEDFSRYEGHTLSRKAINRIFEEIPRCFTSNIPGKMCYEDFIWFMISEEDKTSTRALEYWFKLIDLDTNGIVTAYEMEYFYEEQLHRLEYLNQEVVPFRDVLCQMADMLSPATENQFTLVDFKRQKGVSGVFFNCLVNLNKFIAYEQRDPFAIKHEQTENPDFTDWDRFALAEYVRLAMEEENAENSEVLDEMWDSDQED